MQKLFTQPMTTEQWQEVDRLRPEDWHPLADALVKNARIADPQRLRLTGYVDRDGVPQQLERAYPCSQQAIDGVREAFEPEELVFSVYTGMQQVNHFVELEQQSTAGGHPDKKA